ncbi:MAG: hypothetical protein R3C05_19915 [Pirellulaceae bacterium]
MFRTSTREAQLVSQYLTNVNGTLFFSAEDSDGGFELWKSDRTAAGTVRVADIRPGGSSSGLASGLANVGGTLFFTANDGSSGLELWKSDRHRSRHHASSKNIRAGGSSGPR